MFNFIEHLYMLTIMTLPYIYTANNTMTLVVSNKSIDLFTQSFLSYSYYMLYI